MPGCRDMFKENSVLTVINITNISFISIQP